MIADSFECENCAVFVGSFTRGFLVCPDTLLTKVLEHVGRCAPSNLDVCLV